MIFTMTDIEYDAPEGFNRLDDDHRYGRTADGKFYARAELSICSDAQACVRFLLHVQLSEADWNALREGSAEFVTGRIEEELPRDIIGEYSPFCPAPDKPCAAEASISLGQGDGLDPIFDALAERERELEVA